MDVLTLFLSLLGERDAILTIELHPARREVNVRK
jgi:hypothetical protein